MTEGERRRSKEAVFKAQKLKGGGREKDATHCSLSSWCRFWRTKHFLLQQKGLFQSIFSNSLALVWPKTAGETQTDSWMQKCSEGTSWKIHLFAVAAILPNWSPSNYEFLMYKTIFLLLRFDEGCRPETFRGHWTPPLTKISSNWDEKGLVHFP